MKYSLLKDSTYNYHISFIGRLVLPFAPVNKPLIVDDIGSINDSHQAQWRQVDAS